jgi:hypothetical protein
MRFFMKKNLLLLLTLIAATGSISAMQKFPKISAVLLEEFEQCANERQDLHASMYRNCDEQNNNQEESNPKVDRCKEKAKSLVEKKWEKSGCAIISEMLQLMNKKQ